MSSETTVSAVPRIELRGITKIYPAVVANKNVSLTALPGEIHAVLGENGAGKSTLMKIIYGVVKPDAGEVRWEGKRVIVANPAHARELGIGMVFQHFSLFETLTVAEDRKSTRLNSSHQIISYAVFCLKKKKTTYCNR